MKSVGRRYFIIGALATGAALSWGGLSVFRKFGALPQEPVDSPNWYGGEFHNRPDNYVYKELAREPEYTGGWLKFFLSRKSDRYPEEPVSSRRVNLASLQDGDFVWLGHSSLLIRLGGKTICIDPVLSGYASPIPGIIPAWPGSEPYTAADFPSIDYLCISHDHWDHLDYASVHALNFRQVACGKGVGTHFASWGLTKARELDWDEGFGDGSLTIIFTPSRHFSGRGLKRNKTMWGGFVLDAGSGGRVYFTGDGGYGQHFREIGRKYGPFDMIFTDSGQYNRAWPNVHMFPEQAVQAALDTGSACACPVHIGKFTLSWHPWNEPARRFAKCAAARRQRAIYPLIGERSNILERA